MTNLPPGTIRRRTLLGGGLAALVASTGCRTEQPPSPWTVADLVADDPFYIAHRGGGDNWPEMTEYAYRQAARLPYVGAIEISVCLSADGVLVCSHDPTTLRVTGTDLLIAAQTWSVLSGLKVTSAFTDDPTQPSRPLSRFTDVIEQHIDRLVAFVEPKTPEAAEPLMAAMVALGQPERVVWKHPINLRYFEQAKANGFATWGYAVNVPGHQGERLRRLAAAPEIDMLGAQRSLPDHLVEPVIDAARQNGKKVIMWNIRNVADRQRAQRLGCQGMMTSNIAGVPNTPG